MEVDFTSPICVSKCSKEADSSKVLTSQLFHSTFPVTIVPSSNTKNTMDFRPDFEGRSFFSVRKTASLSLAPIYSCKLIYFSRKSNAEGDYMLILIVMLP